VLTRKSTSNGFRSPPFIYIKGYAQLYSPNRFTQLYLSFFTVCIRSSLSLAFLYLESSTLTRYGSGGLAMLRHTLLSLLPDKVPLGRRDLGLIPRRRSSAPSRTVRTYAEKESLLRPDRKPVGPGPWTVRASVESTTRQTVHLTVISAEISANNAYIHSDD
jgi:hypothetical protein